MIHKVDAFIQRQDDKVSRSEAIRRLVELGLKGKSQSNDQLKYKR